MAIDVLGFDHLDLTVTDLARSERFYDLVLSELGFRRMQEPGQTVVYQNGITSIAIRAASAGSAGMEFDRYRVGLHHLALRAARRQDVDAFHRFLQRHGLRVLDAPADYPQYGRHYYAVFFADPDDIKLELVHWPWGYWRRVLTDGIDPRARYPRNSPRGGS